MDLPYVLVTHFCVEPAPGAPVWSLYPGDYEGAGHVDGGAASGLGNLVLP